MVKGKYIILRKLKYSESDLIIHALSTNGEKKSFIARGALKSKKRFGGGVLEPSHFVEFNYKNSGGPGQLTVLTEANLINDFKGIRSSYEKLDFALKVLDYVNKVSQEGDDTSEFLFNLLGHTLKTLENAVQLDNLQIQFYLKFLLQQGVIQPEPWMSPYLKYKISECDTIPLVDGLEGKLQSVSCLVHQYVVRAE